MKERRLKVPSQIDIELACDADLNKIWQEENPGQKPPSKRISVTEALLSLTSEDDGEIEHITKN